MPVTVKEPKIQVKQLSMESTGTGPTLDELQALTMKQRAWILEYLRNGFNAIGAARVAGYRPESALPRMSNELKNHPKLVPIIRRAIKPQLDDHIRIMNELREYAYSRPKDPITQKHKLKGIELMAKVTRLIDDSPKTAIQINQGHSPLELPESELIALATQTPVIEAEEQHEEIEDTSTPAM